MRNTHEEQVEYLDHLIKNLDRVIEIYTAFQNHQPPDKYTLGQFILDFSPQYMPKEWDTVWHEWRDNPYKEESLLIAQIKKWNLSKGLDK